MARTVNGVERALQVVQATIDHLPSAAVTAARLARISRLEATRARLQHELGRPPSAWPAGSAIIPELPEGPPAVLFLPASPWGPEALAEEARAVARAVEHAGRLGFCSLADASPDELVRLVAGGLHRALHMSGRGRDGTLLLHGDDGATTPVSSGPLTTIVRALGDELRLVVLQTQGCVDLARALTAAVPCAIALDGAVGAPTGRLFVEALYRALGDGATVRAAFDAGCRALALVAIPPGRMPRLLCAEGAAAEQLTLVEP